MTSFTDPVSDFFNRLAPHYRKRSEGNFLSRYFYERLQTATEGMLFDNKIIADIGAGDGALYDFLLQKSPSITYYACDIAPEMLAQSSIPVPNRFIGRASEITWPVPQFDYIFLLGVTTYMSEHEFKETLEFIRKRLTPTGKAIITFTNKPSFDFQLRRWTRKIFFFLKNNVLGQPFPIVAYETTQVAKLIQAPLYMEKIIFLNQTIPYINRLFPKLSFRMAFWIKRLVPDKRLSWFSADFLVIIGGK